jgi:regulator of sigma E protease
LQFGDTITRIDHQPVKDWESVSVSMVGSLGQGVLPMEVLNSAGHLKNAQLFLNTLDQGSEQFLEELGLVPLPPQVEAVLDDFPAKKVGIQPGDYILGVDGQRFSSAMEITAYIQAKPKQMLTVEVQRDQKRLSIPVWTVEKAQTETGKSLGFIGIRYGMPPMQVVRLGVWDAFTQAWQRTYRYTCLTFEMLGKMMLGQVSTKHVGGPLSIADQAGKSIQISFEHFMSFLAMMSISLGVLNLLPIPILDGGQLVYCLIETLLGRPLSSKFKTMGNFIGIVCLCGFMGLAIFNDLSRYVPRIGLQL